MLGSRWWLWFSGLLGELLLLVLLLTMELGVFNNQHGAVTVMDEVVTDRTKQSPPYSPLSP